MTLIFNTVWQFLSKLDVLFGITATLFSGYAALRLLRQRKQLQDLARNAPKLADIKEKIQFYRGIQTINPVGLALSLKDNQESIVPTVKQFLKTHDLKMPVDEIQMNGLNNAQDLEDFVNALRTKRRELTADGVTEVHLFIFGPVMAGALVGAEFDNWIPIKLYHKPTPQPPSVYEYWMPLIK